MHFQVKVLKLALSPLQNEIVQKFQKLRVEKTGQIALLKGVTGSGKTEIYIEVARHVLSEGKGVLILVPEIALTPQLHARFESSLGLSVGLWHSALPNGRKRDILYALKNKTLKILVGARSAIFAPISDLGLIVVDEEHDVSYKQEDRACYHARDLAVVRVKITGSFGLLGSANTQSRNTAKG